MKTAFLKVVALVLTVSCLSLEALALPITDLHNTGVDTTVSASTILPHGAVDPHYRIIASPTGPSTAVTVNDNFFPIPPWLPNVYGAGGSRWIGQGQFGGGNVGAYIYRTTFTVPSNAVLSTVSVSGEWASDDLGVDIRINNTPTLQTNVGFTSYTPFSLNGSAHPIVHGTNTLDFVYNNAQSVTGLRVNRLQGSYQVPEPGTVALALLGCVGSVAVMRRQRAR